MVTCSSSWTEIGRTETVGQPQLPDEDDLQRGLFSHPREPFHLFQHMHGQLLRLIHDE